MHTTEQLNTALAGRYRIERAAGEGGMATVYVARDIRHNRLVALKVLKPELGVVLGPERFLTEIQVTANLQHPNLLPLFDSGEAGGFLFYVMPYVEGETLRARLERDRQFGVDEAVRIASAIAGALDYAHRHQVIHRDLKPENIMLHEGQPLVMDFGIALAVSRAGGARVTQTGLSLGTPQYMSPEQATGDRSLDARSDIYSLGAVLYEMLVGDPPHTGSTVQAVIAKVIAEQPGSVRTTRPNVPEHLEAALMTALAKVPADRFATAADFAAALSGQRAVALPAADSSPARVGSGAAVTRRGAWREVAAWLVAAAGIASAAWLGTRRAPSPPVGRFAIDLPDEMRLAPLPIGGRFAISQDGALLAFVGIPEGTTTRALYVRRADDALTEVVRGSDTATAPSFSPDGKWLLYSSLGRALKKVSSAGGTPQTIVTRVGNDPIFRSSWGDGGRIVFERVSGQSTSLWMTTSDGTEPVLVAEPDTANGIWGVSYPDMLPGGTHALVALTTRPPTPDSARLAVVNLSDGSVSELGIRGIRPQFVAPEQIVFVRQSGTAFAVPFSLRKRKILGPPVRLFEGITPPQGFIVMDPDIVAARNGWLAYRAGAPRLSVAMTAVDRSGKERALGAETQAWGDARVSPDGRRVVARVVTDASGASDLWIFDRAGGTTSRLTADGESSRPSWTADGSRIVYLNGTGDSTRILSRAWDGSGSAAVLLRSPALAEFALGPALQFSAIRLQDRPGLSIAPTDSLAAMRPAAAGARSENVPVISPNGKWLAYESDETGRFEVYVRPLPGPGAKVPVSAEGGRAPRWSSDGRTVFFRGPRMITAATIVERPELAVTRREELFADVYSRTGGMSWDVYPGGREFLFLKGGLEENSQLYFVVNWQQLLRKSRASGSEP